MASEVATFFDRWHADRQKMQQEMPDLARGFAGFHQLIMKEGALSVREKELIALRVGLEGQNDGRFSRTEEPTKMLHDLGSLAAMDG